ncbi:hypothetical protein [Methanosarcina barkeri]|uniref:Uncharacterized protein n=1 Tax=Methanosarcina barkeri CM1 TaxID=796385 RepID=A0A0G3CG30_METBA|nr:hypothetical protein [Methanosarcina barkeri]AKJ38052.1 hypothetical protein MCM1_0989 [Methanosarcina barkeri CM1]
MEIRKTSNPEKNRSFKNKHFYNLRDYSLVGISYTLLTIILTYPVFFKIKTDIPGTGADSFQWMRILWYTKIAIKEANLAALTHDSLLFYPNGIESMPFSSAFNQVLYVLLSPFLELHVIYTILWLLTFIIGAVGSYFLVKYLTDNNYAAFIAGIVFAFSPYHFSRGLYFFGAATVQWIPFCALYLMKTVKEEGIKNPVLAGIFFILVAMSDLQYLIFMGIFAGLVFFYDFYLTLRSRNNFTHSVKQIIIKYLFFGGVAFLGVLPLTINEILIALSKQNFLRPNINEIPKLSNDLMSFFLPSHLHPLLGQFTLDLYSNIPSWPAERVNFIGYIVLGLSILALLKSRRKPDIKFWLVTTFFFTIISLGPILHFNGATAFTDSNLKIPLPYQILYNTIPFLKNCRTVGRFFVIATLGYSVLAGYGFSELLKYKPDRKKLIFTIVGFLLVFEYLSIPYPTTQVSVPDFYYKISNDKDNYAILEIPQNSNAGYMAFQDLYYQTVHNKALVGGYSARYPANVGDFQRKTPFIKELQYYSLGTKDILKEDVTDIGTSVLNANNIRYVIVHKNQLSSDQLEFVTNLLNKTLKTEPDVYDEDGLIVYRVPDETIQPFMLLGKGWNRLENWDGTMTRWISNKATLSVYSGVAENAVLKLNACSLHSPKTLEVYNGKTLQSKQNISTNLSTVNIPVTLNQGKNVILLNVPEGTERPCDFPELKNNDTRKLSIAIQRVRLIHSPED